MSVSQSFGQSVSQSVIKTVCHEDSESFGQLVIWTVSHLDSQPFGQSVIGQSVIWTVSHLDSQSFVQSVIWTVSHLDSQSFRQYSQSVILTVQSVSHLYNPVSQSFRQSVAGATFFKFKTN